MPGRDGTGPMGRGAMGGRIRYYRAVTLAQMQERAVVETGAPCVEDIRRIWNQLGA